MRDMHTLWWFGTHIKLKASLADLTVMIALSLGGNSVAPYQKWILCPYLGGHEIRILEHAWRH